MDLSSLIYHYYSGAFHLLYQSHLYSLSLRFQVNLFYLFRLLSAVLDHLQRPLSFTSSSFILHHSYCGTSYLLDWYHLYIFKLILASFPFSFLLIPLMILAQSTYSACSVPQSPGIDILVVGHKYCTPPLIIEHPVLVKSNLPCFK